MESSKIIWHNWRSLSFEKRLKIANLPHPLRGYVIQIVVVAVISCLLIVLFGLGLYPFEKGFPLPEWLNLGNNENQSMPLSLIIFLLVGMGIVMGALFHATYQPGWKFSLFTRITLGLLAVLLPAYLLKVFWGNQDMPRLMITLLAAGCGAAALVCAFIPSPRVAKWAAGFETGSFVLLAVLYILISVEWGTLRSQNPSDSETGAAILIPISTFMIYMTPLVWFTSVIFFWQAITEVKIFSREIGGSVANLSERISWLLPVLFVIKFIWLAVGYSSVLRGLETEPWFKSSRNTPVEWLLAALFAIATIWWLIYRRKPVSANTISTSAIIITGGFLFTFIAASIVYILASIFTILELGEAGSYLRSLSEWLAVIGMPWTLWFVFIMLPIGLLFLFIKKFRHLSLIFFLTGLWALPNALNIIFPQVKSHFRFLTYDVLLTFVLLVLAVLAWRGKQKRVKTWMITLVLVVSTLAVLGETLIPAGYAYLIYFILLVIPLFYQLLFDSAKLNSIGELQEAHVVRVLGFQALLMLVLAYAVIVRQINPDQNSLDAVANALFMPPLLLLSIAGVITEHESSPQN